MPQKGGVYHLADDITVEFPEGFVSVPSMGFYWNMYSPEQVLPLSFPQGIRPVSAILALHPEEDDIEFIKPIKITMPHCVFMKSAESCRYLAFSKASRKRSGGNRQNGKKLKFDKVSESATLFMKYTKGEENSKLVQPFASFCTQHCCYICMTKDSKENTDDTFFYLTQAIPKNRGESSYFSIHYVFSYCITGCFTVCLYHTSLMDFRNNYSVIIIHWYSKHKNLELFFTGDLQLLICKFKTTLVCCSF